MLNDFVGEVQRSLGYFTNTHRDAHVAYMVGLGNAFKLPGLQKFLGEKLPLEVRKPAKFARLDGDAVLDRPAVPGEPADLPGRLRPGAAGARPGPAHDQPAAARDPHGPDDPGQEALRRRRGRDAPARHRRARAGASGPTSSRSPTRASRRASRSARAPARAYCGQETQVQPQARPRRRDQQKEVKTIIAGQEERLNWPRFFEVETAAMPRPGDPKGGNLTATRMWVGAGDGRRRGARLVQAADADGVPIEQALADDRSKHPKNLAMVNVEAVNTRWVTDARGFLEAVDNAGLWRWTPSATTSPTT